MELLIGGCMWKGPKARSSIVNSESCLLGSSSLQLELRVEVCRLLMG